MPLRLAVKTMSSSRLFWASVSGCRHCPYSCHSAASVIWWKWGSTPASPKDTKTRKRSRNRGVRGSWSPPSHVLLWDIIPPPPSRPP